jgi:CubicO group peptidase (beta-lactamase class C family)
MRLPLYVACLASWVVASCATSPTVSDYEGRYEAGGSSSLLIATRPDDDALFAVVNEARYPLLPHTPDVFLNSTGQEVHFERGANGQVSGYRVRIAPALADNPRYALLDAGARVPANSWRARPPGARRDYAYAAPMALGDGLGTRALARNSELAEGVSAMTEAVHNEGFPNLHSVLIYRDGSLVFEEYFYEFDRDTPHQMRSATKTLMALLVGAAVDRGLIPSIDDPVLPWFAEYEGLAHPDARKSAITLRDLLTMSSGFDCDDWNADSAGNESRMVETDDWARFILDLPMLAEPGTAAAYCSGNVILAGRIVEKASGKPLKAFADETLFGPLGIEAYAWDFRPDRSNVENFVQAWLRPRDMVKIGVLILDDGAWAGRQVIPSDWIREMTTPHAEIDGTPYGFFWWGRYLNLPSGRVELPQATGNGGQKIIVMEAQSAVVVMTGGAFNQQSDTNELMARYILPGLLVTDID